jgi:hypothetical protein
MLMRVKTVRLAAIVAFSSCLSACSQSPRHAATEPSSARWSVVQGEFSGYKTPLRVDSQSGDVWYAVPQGDYNWIWRKVTIEPSRP